MNTLPSITESLHIPGLYFINLEVHEDNRGSFKESYTAKRLQDLGLHAISEFVIVQNNVSVNYTRGVIRGLHAEPWEKYISPASGTFFGAWVDLRPGESFGNVDTREISPSQAVFVPRGVANGFQALTDKLVYSYLVNDYWSKEAKSRYVFVNLADPELAIEWPLGIIPNLLSEDDKNHPLLKDAKAFK